MRKMLPPFDLRKCVWERGRCRVCGAKLDDERATFCSNACTSLFGSAVRRAVMDGVQLSEYGIAKCPYCGKFRRATGDAEEELCEACKWKAPTEGEIRARKENRERAAGHKPQPLSVRMCHACKQRKAAPGSYWCVSCKAKRNAEYGISPSAWESSEDKWYGLYADGRVQTGRKA